MNASLLLLLSMFVPLAGALLLLAKGWGRQAARGLALLVTIVTFVLASSVTCGFVTGDVAAEYGTTNLSWLGDVGPVPFDIRFHVSLDGLGIWLYALTALLMVSAVLVSWEAIEDRAELFYAMLLLLEFGCLGVFAARDIILFYVFFEFTLIPLFFLIGIWGSEDRRYAAVKFFLYTLAGSVLTFLGLLGIVLWDYQHAGTGVIRFSIPELTAALQAHPIRPIELQLLLFLALFAGFAIKVPLFPLHTWLPLAHVQAPTAGSVILAGILLKIGTYGFIRFSLSMLPDASVLAMPWVWWLAVGGIVYGALVALAQADLKKLIAYSSVSHLGFCMLGIFAFNRLGLEGGTLQMVNHGLSTGGLFAIVGMLYERYHTREIASFSGLARQMPWLSSFMLLFTFSSIGLPGLNGFVGEFMVLLASFQRAVTGAPDAWKWSLRLAAIVAVSGVVLGAWYMLWLVQRVFFGPLQEPGHGHGSGHDHGTKVDLTWREFAALAPLAVFVFWIGLQPKIFLDPMAPTLNQVSSLVESRLNTVVGVSSEATQVASEQRDALMSQTTIGSQNEPQSLVLMAAPKRAVPVVGAER